MAQLKTKPHDADVAAFINAVEDEGRRNDCLALVELMRDVVGEEPRMWGSSIVGFGSYHYEYASGHEGDAALVGFSPRKRNLTLYLSCDLDSFEDYLSRLGKHKRGKGCLYLNRLKDVDTSVLREFVESAVAELRKTYPSS